MQITCPNCSSRNNSEFVFAGPKREASPAVHTDKGEITNADIQAWLAYVYYRKNPRGTYVELWQHLHGCRAFIEVQRDTSTHEILKVQLVQKVQKVQGTPEEELG